LIYRNGSGINVNHYESQKWLKLAAKNVYRDKRIRSLIILGNK
ncbi:hypothetical protein U4Y96_18300, partial [Escherichia coli]|nr:hypothetical protein [Escherichia coli]